VGDSVRSEGVRIARQIGVVDGTGPSEALRTLVRYFRGFSPSNEHLHATSGVDLYREIATSQKGVCRHRAYAFMVTALALGLPTRFVRNEAHAWVEVNDGTRFHRIDLGGAADEMSMTGESRVPHVPPRDPFEWPAKADSGQAIADRSRLATAAGNGGGQGAVSAARGVPDPATAASANAAPDPDDRRPRSTVSLQLGDRLATRGGRLPLSGRVEADGSGCAAVRVDLFLEPVAGPARERVALGTLVTGKDGRYEGHVVVPFVASPGDYEVRASTPGDLACGQGQSP
jgi:hypothetical protein